MDNSCREDIKLDEVVSQVFEEEFVREHLRSIMGVIIRIYSFISQYYSKGIIRTCCDTRDM